MNILVTGGAGFIGSHTAVELLLAGHDVVIADNLSNSSESVMDDVAEITGKRPKFYRADIRSEEDLERIFTENRFDAVIHFAGLKAVGESVEKPLKYYENNVGGTITLCRVMQRHACKTIIFSSSATVYGGNNPVPFREDMPTGATNPYGRTKLILEELLRDLAVSDPEWSVVLLRYFNPIGAHPSGLIGENPSGIPNNLFPYLLRVAEGKLPILSVFGNDYDTPDGTGVRDYIHVVDLADGHMKALDYAAKHHGCVAVNLGTSKGTSVLELITAFEKATGVKIPYRITPRRAGDIAENYAETGKAEQLLGWKARYNVDDMCRDGWHYIQKQKERDEK